LGNTFIIVLETKQSRYVNGAMGRYIISRAKAKEFIILFEKYSPNEKGIINKPGRITIPIEIKYPKLKIKEWFKNNGERISFNKNVNAIRIA